MFKFLKRRSASNPQGPGKAEPAIDYNGYEIVAAPREEAGGWTTEAIITREVNGEVCTHQFIRADRSGSREGAVELTLGKCRQTIDQLGDAIFHRE